MSSSERKKVVKILISGYSSTQIIFNSINNDRIRTFYPKEENYYADPKEEKFSSVRNFNREFKFQKGI